METNLRSEPQNTEEVDAITIPGHLGQQAGRLGTAFGTDTAVSALLMALLLNAATGPSRRLKASLGYGIPTALNVVLVTRAPILLRTAIRHIFDPIVASIRETVRTAALQDREHHREAILRLRLELLEAQDVLDGAAPKKMPDVRDACVLNKESAAQIAAYEAPFHRREAAEKQKRLQADLRLLEYRLRPEILVEWVDAIELLDAHVVSFDSALVNLSLGGETLRSLGKVSTRELLLISRFFNASWLGHQTADRNQARAPQISNLWVVDRETLIRAVTSEIKDLGVLNTFLLIEVDSLSIDSTPQLADGAVEAWFRLLNHEFLHRKKAGEETHHLTDEATAAYEEFLNQAEHDWSALDPEMQPFAACWPQLALKLALLLHVGAHDPAPPGHVTATGEPAPPTPVPKLIELESIKAAIQLTKALAARHCALMRKLVKEKSKVPDADVERMVTKIREKQPITRRNLFRTYPRQSQAIHNPVLARALELGLAYENGGFLYATNPCSDPQSKQSGSESSTTNFRVIQPEDAREEVLR
ncbi:MAG: hypothetical protein P4L99_25530 [Chthoniobacter sp.]|nr:hypothetical protein [Chthoniobacter sp.]